MLYKPSFGDRQLTESFYQALLNRFYDSFDLATQEVLRECQFGMAPSPTGVRTFFILAPDLDRAQQLVERIETVIARVRAIVVGIGQTAICVSPPAGCDAEAQDTVQHSPQYMLAKIFPHPPEIEDELD